MVLAFKTNAASPCRVANAVSKMNGNTSHRYQQRFDMLVSALALIQDDGASDGAIVASYLI